MVYFFIPSKFIYITLDDF